jgi:hypothetical protein
MPISPGLPTTGQKITGFGYHGLAEPLQTDSANQMIMTYNLRSSFSHGGIVAVHPVQRDSAMLRFPCFQTSARFDPGMSGGPVVNERGGVRGVICSSYGQQPDSSDYLSYASLLWPTLGSKIDVAPAEGEAARPTAIIDLIQSGYIASDGTEQTVKVIETEEGVRVHIHAGPVPL